MIDWHHPIAVFVSLALVLGSLPASADPAPPPVTGTWTGHLNGDGTLQLNLDREDGRGGFGELFPLRSLRGLSREQAVAGATVRFELVRDAGTIVFDGTFRGGRGGERLL